MAGGKGSRMAISKEKLLLEYKKPIILHVTDALNKSKCFSKIIAVTSQNSPKTRDLLRKNSIELFDSSGNGYVQDLNQILTTIHEYVFVTSGDLPLLDEKIIRNLVNSCDPKNIWTTILVTKKFLESLKLSCDYEIDFNDQKCSFTGISIINAKKISNLRKINENYLICNDKRIAFNLNTKEDYNLLCAS